MKRTKGVLALEGLELAPEAEAPEVPVDVVEDLTDSVEVVHGQIDNYTEGAAIGEAVDAIATGLETSVERGEGVDEVTAGMVNAALENFYQRLGYKPKLGRGRVSMEGLGEAPTRLSNSKVALEQINEFRGQLSKSLKIAHEELVDGVNNHIDDVLKGLGSAGALMKEAVRKHDREGKSEKLISGGRWAQALGSFKDPIVTGADVIERLKEISKKVHDAKPTALVNELTKLADEVAKELGKDGTVSGYGDLAKKLDNFMSAADDLNSLLNGKKDSVGGGDLQFTPLTADEVKEVVKIVGPLGSEAESFSQAFKKLIGAVEQIQRQAEQAEASGQKAGDRKSFFRWVGGIIGFLTPLPGGLLIGLLVGLAMDEKAHKEALKNESPAKAHKDNAGYTKEEAKQTLSELLQLDTELVKLATAVADLIKKSTK